MCRRSVVWHLSQWDRISHVCALCVDSRRVDCNSWGAFSLSLGGHVGCVAIGHIGGGGLASPVPTAERLKRGPRLSAWALGKRWIRRNTGVRCSGEAISLHAGNTRELRVSGQRRRGGCVLVLVCSTGSGCVGTREWKEPDGVVSLFVKWF
jgi:hypothetical protein